MCYHTHSVWHISNEQFENFHTPEIEEEPAPIVWKKPPPDSFGASGIVTHPIGAKWADGNM